jgi:hypothetical protein
METEVTGSEPIESNRKGECSSQTGATAEEQEQHLVKYTQAL